MRGSGAGYPATFTAEAPPEKVSEVRRTDDRSWPRWGGLVASLEALRVQCGSCGLDRLVAFSGR
jgi:hypothetical protein